MSPDIVELQHLIREAQLRDALKLVSRMMPDWKDRYGAEDEEDLRFHCLAVEVLDHAGRYSEAGRLIRKAGLNCQALLREFTDPPDPGHRSLWKQRAWAVLQLGFADYYRRGKLHEALALFELVRAKLVLISSQSYPCWGLRARLAYTVGLVHRQRHEYFKAVSAFSNSVDLAFRRMSASSKARPFYELTAARALALGLGWIHYTEGSISTATSLIQAARALLVGKKEHFIAAYINVLYASVSMSAESRDINAVEEAIQTLTEAHRFFTESEHLAYKARAANELALAFLRQSRNLPESAAMLLQKAEQYALEVQQFGQTRSEVRWRCNAGVVLSRIARARRSWPDALSTAREAKNLALRNHIRFCEIDAEIAVGEALLGQATAENLGREEQQAALEEAESLFEKAVKKAGANAKVESVVHLHLARCNLGMKRLGRAIWHYERAQKASRSNENAFVHELMSEVAQQLASAAVDFHAAFDGIDDAQRELTRFKGWLTTWSVAKVTQADTDVRNTVEKAAEKLGISAAKFHRWRSEAGLPPIDYRRSRAKA